MAGEPWLRRPIRDLVFERQPANPYEHAVQLLEKGELANAIVILQA